MRRFFVCLTLGLFASGCYLSHERPDFATPAPDTGSVVGDAGPMTAPDAGSDAFVPADPDAGPLGFVFETHDLRPSAILVAGGEVWQEVASYRTDAVFDGLIAINHADGSDTPEVAFFDDDGRMIGRGDFPAGMDVSTRIIWAAAPAPRADGFRYFTECVRIPDVMPRSALPAGETCVGYPCSGDTFQVGVSEVHFPDSSGFYFGETLLGRKFQIRRTRLTVTRQALSTTTLTAGLDSDFYRVQISADAAGSASLHAISFDVTGSFLDAAMLTAFRVRKGSTDIAPGDLDIIDGEGNDLLAGVMVLPAGRSTARVTIVFHDDQLVTGPGNVYTLHATVLGPVGAGDEITFSFHATRTGGTGYLVDDASLLDLSEWGTPMTVDPIEAAFIWSDMSEVPHVAAIGNAGGSRDWIDGALIDDLTQSSTLAR